MARKLLSREEEENHSWRRRKARAQQNTERWEPRSYESMLEDEAPPQWNDWLLGFREEELHGEY